MSEEKKQKQKKYHSKEDAIKDHVDNYRSQGWAKGKFDAKGPDRNRIKKIMANVPDYAFVLDVGCNDGSLGVMLQEEKKCTVIGIDVVQDLVQLANCRGVVARLGSAEDLPFKDNYFDVVILAEVLEHLYDPADGLKEIRRVLRPGGVFVGSVPHSEGGLGHKHHSGGDYHQNIFTPESLELLLKNYFDDVDISPTTYFHKWAKKNNIDAKMNQWNNWFAKKGTNGSTP